MVWNSECFEKKYIYIINVYTSTSTNQKQFDTARPNSFTLSSVWFHSSQPLNHLYKDINNSIRASTFKQKVLSDIYFCMNRMWDLVLPERQLMYIFKGHRSKSARGIHALSNKITFSVSLLYRTRSPLTNEWGNRMYILLAWKREHCPAVGI